MINMEISGDILKHIEELTDRVEKTIRSFGKPVFRRYPVTFTLLGIFGFVSVQAGLLGIIERIAFLHENPIALLFFGIIILIITGTLYKWLQNKPIDFKK